MKRKWLPPFLMLFVGAISSITMMILKYETKTMLIILFAVLIVFYIIGSFLKKMLDIFERQNEERLSEIEPAEEETPDTEGQVEPQDT